jgi:anaerobic selenocysteine-containing dehydrogenase
VYKKFEKGLERPDGQPGFRTPTGKIEFYSEKWAEFGYDPLPDYQEPKESPFASPKLAEEFPLIITTGSRLFPFYHSAWTKIALQRELEPYPFVEIHPSTAKEYGVTDGEWVLVETQRGRIRMKAKLTKGMDPRVVHIPRVGWRDECKELGLPGYGYDGANPNILTAAEPADPAFGTPPMRSGLCRIIREEVK